MMLLAVLARAEENRFEVYPLGQADGAPIEQMARALVGADGTVTLDARNQRLLVLATDEQHKRIADLVSKTAVTARNVNIEVSFGGTSAGREQEASLGATGGVRREDGVTHTHWTIKPQVIDRTVSETSNAKQQLLVASGREGRLRVGEQLPYLTWLVDYGITHGAIREQVQWKDVGSFLIVEPTILGDGPLIRIRIVPELSGTVNGSPLQTRYTAAATEVTVSDGETVTIGGGDRNRDFYERFLVGVRRGGSAERISITLTPRIHDLAKPAAAPARSPAGAQALEVWGQKRPVPPPR